MYKNFAENLNKKIENTSVWIVKKDIKSADGKGFFQKGSYITQMRVIDYTQTECVLSLHSSEMNFMFSIIYKEVIINLNEFDNYFEENKELSEKVLKFQKTHTIKFLRNIIISLIIVSIGAITNHYNKIISAIIMISGAVLYAVALAWQLIYNELKATDKFLEKYKGK